MLILILIIFAAAYTLIIIRVYIIIDVFIKHEFADIFLTAYHTFVL